MEDKNEKWYFTPLICILIFLAFIILAPLVINYGLQNWNFTSAVQIDNSDWLGFWGAYIGSALGVLATFFAFSFTYFQNKKQSKDIKDQNKKIQDQNEIIQNQNKTTQEIMQEQMRLRSLPFMDFKLIGWENFRTQNKTIILDNNGIYCSEPEKNTVYMYLDFEIANIGIAPAIDTKISSYKIGHIVESVVYDKKLCMAVPQYPGFLPAVKISFYDREGRYYEQNLEIKSANNGSSWECMMTTPVKINSSI